MIDYLYRIVRRAQLGTKQSEATKAKRRATWATKKGPLNK